ncbi:PrgH/EprH family type III secretion apparatus protein [Enterobacter ludwigii]|jgi:hypothetical protein
MKESGNSVCIVKITTGPLSGNELLLNVDAHKIIIGSEDDYRTQTDKHGFTTYWLPGEQQLEIMIVSDGIERVSSEETGFLLKVTGENLALSLPVIWQELMLPEYFPVLLKKPEDAWRGHALPPTPSAEAPLEDPSLIQPAEGRRKEVYLAGALLLALVITAIWQGINYNSTEHKIKTLGGLLQDSSSPITVMRGEKGTSLVLVKTQRDADWSTQRLRREQFPDPVIIKKVSTFEEEIEKQIIGQIPGLLKVDLTIPCQPLIRRLKSNGAQPDLKQAAKTINRLLGCSQEVRLVEFSPAELFKQAEQGLLKSNVPWRVINKDGNPVFIVNASLNDKQILSVMEFAKEFNHQWGKRYIQFSISLATDYLAGKSFMNNQQGYILLDHNHWYFNPTTL